MEFKCKPLPYDIDALEPFIGKETVRIHYGKHHAGYMERLDEALSGDDREKSLTDIVLEKNGDVFNLAAQVWNHDFYWLSLAPERCDLKEGPLTGLISQSFGSCKALMKQFAEVANGEFGSGWAWLSFDPGSKKLVVESTSDAGNPITAGRVPLLTLDVWEHAYYLDYQHDRGSYVDEFIDAHVNWRFAEANLEAALKRTPL